MPVPVMNDLAWKDLLFHLEGLTHSPYIHMFFWLMWLDIITGYFKAFKTKKFDSKTGTMGLLRHLLVFAVILIVALYARALGYRPVGVTFCMFFVLNYAGSVLENWEVIDIAFPPALKKYVNQLKKMKENEVVKVLDVGRKENTDAN